MRRMRIRTTEVEVDIDDGELEGLLQSTLGLSRPSAVRIAASAPLTERPVVEELRPATGVSARKKSRPTGRRKSGGLASGPSGDGREELLERVVDTDIPNHEAYNAALRAAGGPLERSLLVIHLVKTHLDEKELSSTEIMRILENKFSIPDKESSLRMALMRAADMKPPLVAPSKGPRGNRYWLTQDGIERASTLLGGETTV